SKQLTIEERLNLLVTSYIKNILPISRLRGACQHYLPVEVHQAIPVDTIQLVQTFVGPLYQESLRKIRAMIRDRRLFLSFTIDEFCKIPNTAYVDYLFVILGVYDSKGKNVHIKY